MSGSRKKLYLGVVSFRAGRALILSYTSTNIQLTATAAFIHCVSGVLAATALVAECRQKHVCGVIALLAMAQRRLMSSYILQKVSQCYFHLPSHFGIGVDHFPSA